MFQSLKTQRTSLVSILKLTDSVTEIKHKVGEAKDISRAVAASQDYPESGAPGLGEDDIPVIFKPLLFSPKVPLAMDIRELDLSDIEGLPHSRSRGSRKRPRQEPKRIGKSQSQLCEPITAISVSCMDPLLVLPMP